MLRPAHVVEIETPKKYLLNGIWWGPKKPKRIVIFIHGLTGSIFSARNIVGALGASDTAVLTFNNRGFEQVGEVKQKRGKESAWHRGGAGHEVFTECADDIEGTVRFARKAGVKNIFLAGHSTGCQKAAYWASKNRGGKAVKGIIFFGPLSDYAIALEQDRAGKLAKSVAYARKLVRSGKPHELMPANLGPWFVCDAQRFLSLYTPDSAEEIFTYAQPKKTPKILRSLRAPILVLLAGREEHTKRPAKELAAWFERNISAPRKVAIIPGVGHGFSAQGGSASGGKRGDNLVARHVRTFMKEY